jgi:hypothetical protein
MKIVRWSARELLSKWGFDDGDFHHDAEGIVAPPECVAAQAGMLAEGSHIQGEQYPPYVLCLVEQLRARGVRHIVLDEVRSFHNDTTIASFVYDGVHYVVQRGDSGWFDTLPAELQRLFEETVVLVVCREHHAAEDGENGDEG